MQLVNTTSGSSSSFDGGNQYLVDQTLPAVRKAVFDKFWDGYGKLGVRAVWLDAAEPEHSVREYIFT